MATLRKRPTNSARSAWGYVRYSTAKQGENSVERQVAAIESWAARTGHVLTAISFDFEVSRTTAHDARPGLIQALDALRSAGAVAIVAETVSRFAGDAAILEALRRECRKRGARLAVSNETGNADHDEDSQDLEAFLSKREIKAIRARTRGALAVKKMRGEVVGEVAYGYRRAADGSHALTRERQRRCAPDCAGCLHVEPDPGEAAVIARAKALSDEGLSIRKIAAALDAEGITGRTGRPLSHTQVHRFLRPLLLAVAVA